MKKLIHICEPLHGFGKIRNGLIRVAMLDTVAHTMLDMSFQDHLSGLMQSRFGGIDLCKNIFAGNILIDHAVNRLYLTNDFL